MRIKEKTAHSPKKLRSIGIITVIATLAILLTIAGLAIGDSIATDPEMSIVATNLSFSDSIYIKYAVSFENVTSAEDVKLLVWTDCRYRGCHRHKP